MAPRKFHKFRSLPLELRRHIWFLAMEPRVVRAQWEHLVLDDDYKAIYRLFAGNVPRIFQVNRESRAEAKRHYSLIGNQLSFKTERLSARVPSIYINFNIDTIYFVNFPSSFQFLSWLEHVSKRCAEQKIQHIAFPFKIIERIDRTVSVAGLRLTVFYHACVENPSIKSITTIMDNSKYENSEEPQKYRIKPLETLAENDEKKGGASGKIIHREKVEAWFDEFFENPRGTQKTLMKWKKFRERNSQWTPPKLEMCKLRLVQKATG